MKETADYSSSGCSLEKQPPTFREELETLLNKHSMENGSNTPDFMLAEYLCACLTAFDRFVNRRECWYGRGAASANGLDQPVGGPTA